MLVTKPAKEMFKEREQKVLSMIKTSLDEYIEIGIFGSYARGDCNVTSDIDFYVIVEERPSRYVTGEIRANAEILKVDIVFITRKYFEESEDLLIKNIKRDRRILCEKK